MTNDSTKISFIPKNSLIAQDPFLSRRRPRSVLGVLATLFLFVSVGAYAGLYAYEISLNNEIKKRTVEIQDTNKTLKESTVIAQAKIFQARTQIGKEILSNHVVVSPLLQFVADNTVQTVQLENFSFKQGPEGSRLVLKGEAPGYAALAFQSDVLKKQKEELLSFAITDVKLTPSGSVTFSLEENINPSFVSYGKNFKDINSVAPSASVEAETATKPPADINTSNVSTATTTTSASQKDASWSQKFLNLFK